MFEKFTIEATSDTHFPVKGEQFQGADVLVVAGDLMMQGTAEEGYPALDAINALPHKHKIVVGGNHDRMFDPSSQYHLSPALIEHTYPGIIFLGHPFRRDTVELYGRSFLGLPYVTNLPRWAFNRDEYYLSQLVKTAPETHVVISHSPPMFTRDGSEVQQAWGVAAYREILHQRPPEVWICGHIHESYGLTKGLHTSLYNVAMCDEHYKQVNKPVIISMQVIEKRDADV